MRKKKVYNKLIRDRIAEIIGKEGLKAKTRVLNKREYEKELKKKLVEEARELVKAKENELLNEIADVQEIIDTLLKLKSFSKTKLAKFQTKKRQKRGGFKKRLFLESVKGV
jgi:predicted house-cleaning noncanonical NTP pyrophosphatase (MazG superfamily)